MKEKNVAIRRCTLFHRQLHLERSYVLLLTGPWVRLHLQRWRRKNRLCYPPCSRTVYCKHRIKFHARISLFSNRSPNFGLVAKEVLHMARIGGWLLEDGDGETGVVSVGDGDISGPSVGNGEPDSQHEGNASLVELNKLVAPEPTIEEFVCNMHVEMEKVERCGSSPLLKTRSRRRKCDEK